ncbi:hypothetical protein LM599_03485 [Candidatus Acetothermia bacterium]|nr:hypothetical protein [Candidatus Acetothermia bacterium]MCI2427313.1 hypothetical protein [Candidatus Acetothermia bacterium]MCI2428251.1 hypothetical protein [Candidatus Acetothermia bacterium]
MPYPDLQTTHHWPQASSLYRAHKKERAEMAIWQIPFILTLLGIVVLAGRFGPLELAALPLVLITTTTLANVGYSIFRSKRGFSRLFSRGNLLGLLPGHLLLLLAIVAVPLPSGFVYLWILVPTLTIAYDLLANEFSIKMRIRILFVTITYCIIWSVLFLLARQIIIAGRRELNEVMVTVLIVVGGALFLAVAIYRHIQYVTREN